MTTAMYIQLAYDDYKNIEAQMKQFAETSHSTEPGFYHKSIRLKITEGLVFEFHGPLVKAAEPVAPRPAPVKLERNSR